MHLLLFGHRGSDPEAMVAVHDLQQALPAGDHGGVGNHPVAQHKRLGYLGPAEHLAKGRRQALHTLLEKIHQHDRTQMFQRDAPHEDIAGCELLISVEELPVAGDNHTVFPGMPRSRPSRLSSMSLSSRRLKSQPAFSAAWGSRLVAVMPGIVLVSSR